MSQSATIGAVLLAAFVLYLAAKNRLITYEATLWGASGSVSSGSGGSTVGSKQGDPFNPLDPFGSGGPLDFGNVIKNGLFPPQ